MPQSRGAGMVRPHEAVHEFDLLRPAIVHDRPGLRGGRGERLLAQDVLAGVGGFAGPFGVQGVGERDVDGVDVSIGEQRLVAAMGDRDVRGFGRGRRLLGRAAGDGNQVSVRRAAEAGQEPVVDLRDAEDAPAEFVHGRLS